MAVTHFTGLVAWQLANTLRIEVYNSTRRSEVARDVEFCRQIIRSSSLVPANIAEGFACYSHREFARYLAIGRGSLMETQNHLIDGASRGHLAEQEFHELWGLSTKAMGAITALLKYLQSTPRRD